MLTWTGSANGRRRRWRSAAATVSRPFARSTSRTRSGCSTPPSPTTPASRSIPARYKVMGLAPYGEPKYRDVILDNLIDLKEDGSFQLDMDYFDYCTGLTMTNRRFDDLFGRPAAPERGMGRAARQGPRGLDPGGHRGGRVAVDPRDRQGDRDPQSLPRGRRGAQLCRQRQGVARRRVRRHLGAAGGGRRGRRARCRVDRDLSVQGSGTPYRESAGRDARQLSRARIRAAGDRTSAGGHGRPVRDRRRRRPDRHRRRRAGRRPGRRLVSRPHGVRSAGARRAIDPRRSALADDAEDAEPEDQVPRELPAVRASVLREDVAEWFEMDCDSPYMLLVAA